jgi:hypothetical protein
VRARLRSEEFSHRPDAPAPEGDLEYWLGGIREPPRGMRDFLPADKARRERVLAVIRERYRAHGFDEIETPVMEDYDRLHAGIGGDNEKLAFNVLKRGLDAEAIAAAEPTPLDSATWACATT